MSKKKEVINIDSANSSSEGEIKHGKGIGHVPQVFVDPGFAATVPCTESEESEVEVVHNFTGKYCEKCAKQKHEKCRCNCSDWSDDLMEVEPPMPNQTCEGPITKQESTHTNNQNSTSKSDLNIIYYET